MPDAIHLYASDSPVANATGSIGLLCEFAADSPWLAGAEACYTAEEILGSADAALKTAYSVVTKIFEVAPQIEGLPLLSVFEEELLEQISYIVQALHLDRWIRTQGFACCHFVSHSRWLQWLRQVRVFSGSAYAVESDARSFHRNSSTRTLRRIWNSRPSFPEIVGRALPHASRYVAGLSKRGAAKQVPSGGIWFYSSSYTCTKIALEYESYFPEKLNYLVENPATGGRRLRELGREWDFLYAWSRASDFPTRKEVREAGARMTEAIAALDLADEEAALRSVLLKSEWWQVFLRRHVPYGLFNGRVLKRWRESVQPEMIVVGNAGWERNLLMCASWKRVPTVLLQHGIMHWVYAVMDEPVDVFLLRGPFFQRVINERLRRKAVIYNPPSASSPAVAEGERDSILFITTPYHVPMLFHPEDRRDILCSLLRVAHASGRRLVIRVHPMEKIVHYRQEVFQLQAQLGVRPEVSFSQGAGVDEVLKRSRVAVLHFSTMFLDCLRHGIPIISFGWHWFPNRFHFEREGIFNFAGDLNHFEDLLRQGISGKLPSPQTGIEQFLAPSRPESLSQFLGDIWEHRQELSSEKLSA